MNKMTRVDVSEQELEVFLNVADRLGIGVRDLLEKDVPFREMELAQQFPVASEVFCFSVKNAAITAGVS
jgi:hypothetical protein